MLPCSSPVPLDRSLYLRRGLAGSRLELRTLDKFGGPTNTGRAQPIALGVRVFKASERHRDQHHPIGLIARIVVFALVKRTTLHPRRIAAPWSPWYPMHPHYLIGFVLLRIRHADNEMLKEVRALPTTGVSDAVSAVQNGILTAGSRNMTTETGHGWVLQQPAPPVERLPVAS